VIHGTDHPEQAEAVVPWGARLVVAGLLDSRAGGADIGVVRLRANGSFDQTFGGDGKIRVDLAHGSDGGADVAIQANGRIVVAGTGRRSGTYRMVVLRLLRG
jgi:hypothetical protein